MSPPHNVSPPAGERLARLEAQMDQLLLTAARARADLREQIVWQRRAFEAQNQRLTALEKSSEETRTHLKWMKAVWLAVQGSVIGWLGIK